MSRRKVLTLMVAGIVLFGLIVIAIIAVTRDTRTFSDANVVKPASLVSVKTNNLDIVGRHCSLTDTQVSTLRRELAAFAGNSSETIDPVSIAQTGDENGTRCTFTLTDDKTGIAYYGVFAYRNEKFDGSTTVYAADRTTPVSRAITTGTQSAPN